MESLVSILEKPQLNMTSVVKSLVLFTAILVKSFADSQNAFNCTNKSDFLKSHKWRVSSTTELKNQPSSVFKSGLIPCSYYDFHDLDDGRWKISMSCKHDFSYKSIPTNTFKIQFVNVFKLVKSSQKFDKDSAQIKRLQIIGSDCDSYMIIKSIGVQQEHFWILEKFEFIEFNNDADKFNYKIDIFTNDYLFVSIPNKYKELKGYNLTFMKLNLTETSQLCIKYCRMVLTDIFINDLENKLHKIDTAETVAEDKTRNSFTMRFLIFMIVVVGPFMVICCDSKKDSFF